MSEVMCCWMGLIRGWVGYSARHKGGVDSAVTPSVYSGEGHPVKQVLLKKNKKLWRWFRKGVQSEELATGIIKRLHTTCLCLLLVNPLEC